MVASASAHVEPGALAGCPLPNRGSAAEVSRSLVRRNEFAGSPGFTSASPVAVPSRFAAGAFTSVAYGWPAKLGPLFTAAESAEWQLIWPTPQPTWKKCELMLEKVGCRTGQVRVPSMQAPCEQ